MRKLLTDSHNLHRSVGLRSYCPLRGQGQQRNDVHRVCDSHDVVKARQLYALVRQRPEVLRHIQLMGY